MRDKRNKRDKTHIETRDKRHERDKRDKKRKEKREKKKEKREKRKEKKSDRRSKKCLPESEASSSAVNQRARSAGRPEQPAGPGWPAPARRRQRSGVTDRCRQGRHLCIQVNQYNTSRIGKSYCPDLLGGGKNRTFSGAFSGPFNVYF